MNRIERLTDLVLDMYLMQAGESKHAHENGGWPPRLFFRDDEFHILKKRSIVVPKSYVKKDGTVSVHTVINILRESIRADIRGGLGYYCGLNVYGNWQVFHKRSTNIAYFNSEYRELLSKI